MKYCYNLGLLFNEVVRQHGSREALRYVTGSLTYDDLNAHANSLASYLADAGIKAGDAIAIINTKELESYAMMIACLKIGVAYTNMDVDLPQVRAQSIIETCRPKILFADKNLSSSFQELADQNSIPFVSLKKIPFVKALNPESNFSSDKIAYIMFTSGSTGQPKGVAITHQNIFPFIEWGTEKVKVTPDDVFANVSPMYFDNSVFDFYNAFFNGACIAPLKKEVVNEPKALIAELSNLKCTIWFSVPSLLMYLTTVRALTKKNFSTVRIFVFGGEGYPKKELQKLYREMGPQIRLLNVYGPTEGTCICSCYDISEETFQDLEGLPPLGPMNPNFDFKIVDENGLDADEGELYILGPNIALGYYNDFERSRNSFVELVEPGRYRVQAYKTGDMVRKDTFNVLYFVGRKDNQIKHMGYRIELEEIELAMGLIPEINQSAVIYHRERSTYGKIVAFYSSEQTIDTEVLRNQLSQKLPAYMIPNTFVPLDVLPKNPNGKVDKHQLKAIMERV